MENYKEVKEHVLPSQSMLSYQNGAFLYLSGQTQCSSKEILAILFCPTQVKERENDPIRKVDPH